MYRKLDESTDSVLGYLVGGTLTSREAQEIRADVEQAVERHGKLRLLCCMQSLDFPEPGAIWEDLKLTPHYINNIERFALVGNKAWHQWIVTLSDWLSAGQARYFEESQLAGAWEWVKAQQ